MKLLKNTTIQCKALTPSQNILWNECVLRKSRNAETHVSNSKSLNAKRNFASLITSKEMGHLNLDLNFTGSNEFASSFAGNTQMMRFYSILNPLNENQEMHQQNQQKVVDYIRKLPSPEQVKSVIERRRRERLKKERMIQLFIWKKLIEYHDRLSNPDLLKRIQKELLEGKGIHYHKKSLHKLILYIQQLQSLHFWADKDRFVRNAIEERRRYWIQQSIVEYDMTPLNYQLKELNLNQEAMNKEGIQNENDMLEIFEKNKKFGQSVNLNEINSILFEIENYSKSDLSLYQQHEEEHSKINKQSFPNTKLSQSHQQDEMNLSFIQNSEIKHSSHDAIKSILNDLSPNSFYNSKKEEFVNILTKKLKMQNIPTKRLDVVRIFKQYQEFNVERHKELIESMFKINFVRLRKWAYVIPATRNELLSKYLFNRTQLYNQEDKFISLLEKVKHTMEDNCSFVEARRVLQEIPKEERNLESLKLRLLQQYKNIPYDSRLKKLLNFIEYDDIIIEQLKNKSSTTVYEYFKKNNLNISKHYIVLLESELKSKINYI